MNVIVILPSSGDDLTLDRLDTIAADIWEAWHYTEQTGREIRMTVAGFDKDGKPVYVPIPADELTAVEERELRHKTSEIKEGVKA